MDSSTGLYQRQEMFTGQINKYDNHEMLLIKGKIHVPTWSYDINYRCFDDRIDIEFSLPKFIYGTNVLELRSHYFKLKMNPYELLTKSIKKFFSVYFTGHKIDYGGISVSRWDFCYNQVFESKEQSLQALAFIKKKYSKKTDTQNYETSFIALSKSKYFKIYHKGSEFAKHDYFKVKGYHNNFQYLSDKTLRYEKKITPKNLAYWYNVNIVFGTHSEEVKKYKAANSKGLKTKQQRRDFELVPKFTLGTSKMLGYTKITEFVFNHLYTIFRDDIKSKYSIGNTSLDRLEHETIKEENPKNKTMKIRILSLIKVFGSIEKAIEKKAISRSTGYNYKTFMNQTNLSTTNVKSNIFQCWTSERYFNEVWKQGININKLTQDLNF